MPAIDEDEPSPEELEALRGALARDPALRAELELILPALDPAARLALLRTIARTGAGRPAAVVLEALVAAAVGTRAGRRPRRRD